MEVDVSGWQAWEIFATTRYWIHLRGLDQEKGAGIQRSVQCDEDEAASAERATH